MKLRTKEEIAGYLFIIPVVTLLGLFLYYPAVRSFLIAFTEWNVFNPPKWVGFTNFYEVLGDPRWLKACYNTLWYLVICVPTQFFVPLALALFLNKKVKGIGIIRTGIFVPVITSVVIASIVWMFIYEPRTGLLNALLQKLKLPRLDYLSSVSQALPAITVFLLWKGSGFYMIIFLAGLQNIPRTYYEAAEIDGVNRWQRFWFLTFPLLKYSSIFIVVLITIGTFKLFGEVYVMTYGGPAYATVTPVMYMYIQAFRFFNMGYASTMAVFLFGIIFIVTLCELKLLEPARK